MKRIAELMVPIVFLGVGLWVGRSTGQVCIPGTPGCADEPGGFRVKAYAGQIVKDGGKCLDYIPEAVGTPLFLNDCSSSHAIHVVKLPERMGRDGCPRKHEVQLKAGNKVIGVRVLPPEANALPALELQDPPLRPLRAPRSMVGDRQTFVLDGDSIILAEDRDQLHNSDSTLVRVVQVENARGADRSPIVLGPRHLADHEFFKFERVDGTDFEPGCTTYRNNNDETCQFKHVSGLEGLDEYLYGENVPYNPNGNEGEGYNQPCSDGLDNDGDNLIDRDDPGCRVPPTTCYELDGRPKWPDYDTVIYVESPPILLGPARAIENSPASIPPVPFAASSPLHFPFSITDGVSVRGDRRGTRQGPLLAQPGAERVQFVMFETLGNDIRLTGLRIDGGHDPDFDSPDPRTWGIGVHERTRNEDGTIRWIFSRIVIDHNDISRFATRAVLVSAGDPTSKVDGYPSRWECESANPTDPPCSTRDNRVRVVKNFLHHNEDPDGYGVNANSGGFPLIVGNTFVWNRHAIAATNSTPETGYRAYANLVLRDAPLQRPPFHLHTHDFDIHGTDPGEDGRCGLGGGFTEVAWNTFLGSNRHAFELRGFPCESVEFHHNVSLQSREDTQNFDLGVTDCLKDASSPIKVGQGWFNQSNPTDGFSFGVPSGASDLGVGDFDGDGVEDIFLATGAAFYYSPAGRAEWRLLASGRTDRLYRVVGGRVVRSLLLGDFDDDGRTDVVGKNGANLMVSWGGTSEWERLNQAPAPIQDLAVGNFDGTGPDDLFWADGARWHIAYGKASGGIEDFVRVNNSRYKVHDLRFGDFNDNGTTDCFGVVDDAWQYSEGAVARWYELGTKRADIDDLFIGDFDGDGRDDVGHLDFDLVGGNDWQYSKYGTDPFVTIVETRDDSAAAWGRFLEGSGQTVLLFWDNDEHLDAAYVGSGGDLKAHSRQDMR